MGDRRRRGSREPPGQTEQGADCRQRSGRRPPGQPPRDGQRVTVLVQALHVGYEIRGGRVPRASVGLDASADEAAQRLGDLRIDRVRRRRRGSDARVQILQAVFKSVRPMAAEQDVVQDQPERIDVGTLVDGPRACLFGRHVFESPDHRPNRGVVAGACTVRHPRPHDVRRGRPRLGHRPGDAEVHDHRLAVAADHEVGRLQIPMHDSRRVGGSQPGHRRARNLQRTLDREFAFAPQDRGEIFAFDVRHRDVLDALYLAEVVNPHHVPVGDLACEQELLLEASFQYLRRVGIRTRRRADHLDRDDDAELPVPGLIDRTHPSEAEQPDDVIAIAKVLAGHQRAVNIARVRSEVQRLVARAGRQPGD